MSRARARAVAAALVVAAAGVAAAVWITGDGGTDDPGSSSPAGDAVDAGDTGDAGDAASSTSGPPGTTSTTSRADALAERVEQPSEPADLAAAIEASERAIRDPATAETALGAWGRLQQRAYRELARRPEWDGAVLEALGDDLAGAVTANVRANRELWALTEPREALPDWRIVEPPDADELLAHYRSAEAEFGVPWEYLAAIHLVESRMGRIRGDSVAGARGPMQFLPATWEAYGEGDIEDPGDAIRAAGRYLAANGAPERMADAVYAYNHSDHYVEAIEGYVEVMRAEERAYLGYHHWQVYYRTVDGDVLLPVGYGS